MPDPTSPRFDNLYIKPDPTNPKYDRLTVKPTEPAQPNSAPVETPFFFIED